MTAALTSLGLRAAADAPPPAAKAALDQADFLQLLTAQLKFQDPTKPLDNMQYIQQLAQFSTVSGIAESNVSLRAIADKLDRLLAATQPAP